MSYGPAQSLSTSIPTRKRVDSLTYSNSLLIATIPISPSIWRKFRGFVYSRSKATVLAFSL